MKKFTKVCLILAAVFCVLGLVFFIAGRGLNGKLDSNPFLHFRNGFQIGWTEETVKKISEYIGADASQKTQDAETYADQEEEIDQILGGDEIVELLHIDDGEQIEELSLTVGGGIVAVLAEQRKDIRVCVNQAYVDLVKNDVTEHSLDLEVSKKNTLLFNDSPVMTVQIPEGLEFQKIDIEVGAGMLKTGALAGRDTSVLLLAGKADLQSLRAKEADIQVQAGRLSVQKLETSDAELDCDAGMLTVAEGVVTNTAKLECNVGTVKADLEGDPDVYTYKLDCAAGSIKLNGKHYGGVIDKTIRGTDSGEAGSRKMEISCNVGNITVNITVPPEPADQVNSFSKNVHHEDGHYEEDYYEEDYL